MSRQVLVYGSAGQLGRAVSRAFNQKGFTVTGIDLAANSDCEENIVIREGRPSKQQAEIMGNLDYHGTDRFDACICVAGGWAGGNTLSPTLMDDAYKMIASSVYPSMISSHIAAAGYVKKNGLLLLPGAAPVLGGAGTSFMIPYGVAKAAVHQLVSSLAADDSGIPGSMKVAGIAPRTLNTEDNRKAMPNLDHSSWTPLDHVCAKILSWTEDPSGVERGKIYEIVTEAGETKFVV